MESLAITALILAVVAFAANLAFFAIQSWQANSVKKENTEFAKEMHAVLGEIKGLTNATREQMQTQFDKMLDATLERQREVVSEAVTSDTVAQVEEITKRLDTVTSDEASSKSMKEEIQKVKESLDSFKDTLADSVAGAFDSQRTEANGESLAYPVSIATSLSEVEIRALEHIATYGVLGPDFSQDDNLRSRVIMHLQGLRLVRDTPSRTPPVWLTRDGRDVLCVAKHWLPMHHTPPPTHTSPPPR